MNSLFELEARMEHAKNIRQAQESSRSGRPFEIGDQVGLYFGGGTLIGYVEEIRSDGVVVCRNKYPDGGSFCSYSLNFSEYGGLYHIKDRDPAYKTYDKVQLYVGDFYWCVNDRNDIFERIAAPGNSTSAIYKEFSTKKAAQEYVKNELFKITRSKKSWFKRMLGL